MGKQWPVKPSQKCRAGSIPAYPVRLGGYDGGVASVCKSIFEYHCTNLYSAVRLYGFMTGDGIGEDCKSFEKSRQVRVLQGPKIELEEKI